MTWISVKERLPENTKDVLIYHDANETFMASRIDDKWHLYYSDTGRNYDRSHQQGITHWMPLPEPPKI